MNVMSKTGGGGQGGGSCSSNKDAQHVVPQGIGKLAQELQSAVLDLGVSSPLDLSSPPLFITVNQKQSEANNV